MWFQWSEQREYMDMSWGCGKFLATIFVLVNLIGQLGGCVMVIIRYRVNIACGVLFFIVVLQVSISDVYFCICFCKVNKKDGEIKVNLYLLFLIISKVC